MDRRRTTIVVVTGVGLLAASTAAFLAVPTTGTAVPVEEPLAVESTGTQQEFWGTNVVLPEDYAAFYLSEGALVSVGETKGIDTETLDSITAQLQAAPPQSVVYVDVDSLNADGLTTALATVTPTNGHTLGTTNEAIGQWLAGLFPDKEGTVASLDIPNVPNASLTYTETTGEVTWQVTEYVFQYADATVSVRLSTVDDSGETRAEFDQMMAGMTR